MSQELRHYVFVDRPPEESRSQRIVQYNFWLSTILVMGMVVLSYVVVLQGGEQFAPMGMQGRYYRVNAANPGGLMYLILEVFGWAVFYRKGGNEARATAGFVGLFLLAGLAVFLGVASSPSGWVTFILLYAIASHLSYAIGGSRQRIGY